MWSFWIGLRLFVEHFILKIYFINLFPLQAEVVSPLSRSFTTTSVSPNASNTSRVRTKLLISRGL